MATKDPRTPMTQSSLDYNDYTLRVANLIFKVAPSAVRVFFDKQFQPDSLQLVLNQNRFKTLQHLKTKKIINQRQWELLFPLKGVASSISFDLTLMICLLRNIAKMKISDDLPTEQEMSEENALSILKFYRNKISHNELQTLSEIEFNQHWDSLSEAIIILGGDSYRKICVELQSYKLDKEILLEVQNLCSPVSPIPRGLQDIYEDRVREWRQNNEKIVKTKAITALTDMIETNHVCIVSGPPGCGKSTAIHTIALQLHDENGYDLIPAKFPQDITQYYIPERKQVFVFDDVFGRYTLETQAVNTWDKLAIDITSVISKDTIKILCTCRAYIFNHKKIKNIKIPWKQIDLLSPAYALSNEEKDLIAKIYLTDEQVEDLKQQQDLDQYECFPLLCQLCSSKGTCDVVKFFASPVSVIKDDLSSIMESEDQTSIATLALFVVFNNSINEKKLTSKDQELRDVLQQLSQFFTTRNILTVQIIKDHLYNLTNTYVLKASNKFTLLHNKLYDIVASFFGEQMFDFTIECSHPEFIRDRFQFECITECNEECIIAIAEDREEDFIKRLFQDLEHGFIDEVFANRQFQFNIFRKKFIQFVKDHKDAHASMLSCCPKSPLFEVVKKGQTSVAEMLIESGIDPDITDNHGRTAVYFAAAFGHVETVKMLIDKHCDLNISRTDYWHKDESPLYVAAAEGHLEILKLLYRNKQDCYRAINEAFYRGKTPLHGAIEGKHADIVTFFMENECDPNILSEDHESPLWLAAGNGNTIIVEILLKHKSNPNLHTKKNGPPLITASWNRHAEVVSMLLKYGADPNLTNSKGCSSLFYAAHEGSAEIVKLLLDNKANINSETNTKMTPLFISSIKGREEVVELLLQNGAFVNRCNEDNESPLFVAAKQGFIGIVKLLLAHRAKTEIANVEGETALSMATRFRFTEIENVINEHTKCKLHAGHSSDQIHRVHVYRRQRNACCTVS